MEQQLEEREALHSIYEGDPAFKEINATTYQYKYGLEDDYRSFLVEIIWGLQYPLELPTINLDTFYNRNLVPAVKQNIKNVVLYEAEQWIGCAMTYTLFECLKERLDELTIDQPQGSSSKLNNDVETGTEYAPLRISDNMDAIRKTESKKEQLTKAQKRRQWERTDQNGERPRGWNWVDIIKHLSQTGIKEKSSSADRNHNNTSVS